MVDSEGKAVEVPSSKSQEKKKKTKTSVEEAFKKAKLLALNTSSGRTAKVHLTLLMWDCMFSS